MIRHRYSEEKCLNTYDLFPPVVYGKPRIMHLPVRMSQSTSVFPYKWITDEFFSRLYEPQLPVVRLRSPSSAIIIKRWLMEKKSFGKMREKLRVLFFVFASPSLFVVPVFWTSRESDTLLSFWQSSPRCQKVRILHVCRDNLDVTLYARDPFLYPSFEWTRGTRTDVGKICQICQTKGCVTQKCKKNLIGGGARKGYIWKAIRNAIGPRLDCFAFAKENYVSDSYFVIRRTGSEPEKDEKRILLPPFPPSSLFPF